MYDNHLKDKLFHAERKRRHRRGQSVEQREQNDPIHHFLGPTVPRMMPESTAWFKRQQKNLYAMADDAELGMFGTMTTITYNDASPEMLAAIRRGPLAQPTEDEMVEYLDRAWSKDRKRLDFEQHAFEHVLSFQKRLHAFKRLPATELCLKRASAFLFAQIISIVMFAN